ncbi:MAG: WbqC family protein [Saprospiraceae bacterium]
MPILIELQFFPPVQYFSKMLLYPAVVFDQHEHYQKRSYRNRCHIATSHGVQRLSVPLQKGKNQQMPVRDVRIAYEQPWARQMEHALRSAYQRAPFFEEYAPALLTALHRRHNFLFDLNLELLNLLAVFLQLKRNWSFSEDFQASVPEGWTDLRNAIHPVHPASDPLFSALPYNQVFEDRLGFSPNLSIIDLLFCAGPESASILKASYAT